MPRTLRVIGVTLLLAGCGGGNQPGAQGSSTGGQGSGATSSSGVVSVSSTGRSSATIGSIGTSTSGSVGTSGGSGGNNNWPIVQSQGSPVISNPNLIFLNYSDDTNLVALQQYGVWISDGGYLPLVASQYGIGNGIAQFVNLGSSNSAPTGTVNNQNAFPNYLAQLFNDNAIPPYDPSNIYIFEMPSDWADTTTFCQTLGGYHDYADLTGGATTETPVYAVIPSCPAVQGLNETALQLEEVALSHEIIEASTDPLLQSYQIQDTANPWYYVGGELADLCQTNSTNYVSGSYAAQLIWSNQAVQAGQVPCQPWSAQQTYYSLIGPSTLVSAAAGQTVNVTVTGWSNTGGDDTIGVYTYEGDYGVAFNPVANQSFQTTVKVGQSVQIPLTVPAGTQSGSVGAANVIAYDSNFMNSYGGTVVGVVVQ